MSKSACCPSWSRTGERCTTALPKAARREWADQLMDRLHGVLTQPQEAKPCHWIHGGDDGQNYCRNCCIREIRKRRSQGERGLSLDGGFSIEHDSRPYCETCGCGLDGSLTEYAAQSEIEHYAMWEVGGDALSQADVSSLIDVLTEAAYIDDVAEEFGQVCAWVEGLLDRDRVLAAEQRKRCRTTLYALQRASRKCRRKCSKPSAKCKLASPKTTSSSVPLYLSCPREPACDFCKLASSSSWFHAFLRERRTRPWRASGA